MEIHESLCETILSFVGGEEKFLENVLFRVKLIDGNVNSGNEFAITLDCTNIRQMEEVTPDLQHLTFRNGAKLTLSKKAGCQYRPDKDCKYEFFGFLKGSSYIEVLIYCMKKRLEFQEDITVNRFWIK